jgi:hypothetical protein
MFKPPSRPSAPGPVELFRCGVGHPLGNPPEALSDMGRADATSRENDRPAGVVCCFQVIEYSVDPYWRVFSISLSASIFDRSI